MRSYVVPPDLNEKEKVIGGVLNINQFVWILIGLILGAVMVIAIYKITNLLWLSFIVGFLFGLTGVPFAFYKKNDLTLYQHLYYKRKHYKKTKKLPNIRKNMEF